MEFIFTKNTILSSLTFEFTLFTTSPSSECKTIKSRVFNESSHLVFQKVFFRQISTYCYKVFCHLCSCNEKWYWQLYFGSNLTIVSLWCLRMAWYAIQYLNDGWDYLLQKWLLYIWDILHFAWEKTKGQSQIYNPQTQATLSTRHRTKTKNSTQKIRKRRNTYHHLPQK